MSRSSSTATGAPALNIAAGSLLCGSILFALLLSLPRDVLGPEHLGLLTVLGVIGSWRYSWAAIHLVRALVYRRLRFPVWRRAADGLGEAGRSPEVFFLVTSYRIDSEVTAAVYRAIFEEAIDYRARTVIVAAVTDAADEVAIEGLLTGLTPTEHLSLVLMRQRGTGKRDALGAGLRAIARRRPAQGSVVVIMDGDTVVTPGTLRRCLPLFRLMPDVGALTTDERGIVSGSDWVKEWYDLRFAQRHLLMSSMALSRRVLTLTGRLSMFRAELAVDPGFIRLVEEDFIDHWRLGRFRLLTGDDKSTWFWLLKHGWRMLYVPDVQVQCLEQFPNATFLPGSVRLMARWFGNMLRANGRAIALGPGRTGFFTWWCLIDQRLSRWTTLLGPALIVCYVMRFGPAFLTVALAWIMMVKLVQAAVIGTLRRRFSPYFPPLLYYNQVVGALVKAYMSVHLDRQAWTRQGIRATRARGAHVWITRYVAALTAGGCVLGPALLSGLLPSPDRLLLRKAIDLVTLVQPAAAFRVAYLGDAEAGDADAWMMIQARIAEAPRGATVQLAPGVYPLSRSLQIERDHVTLAGAGVGRTVLRASFPGSDIGVINIEGEMPRDVSAARRWSLARPLSSGGNLLTLNGAPIVAPGTIIAIRAANDPDWLAALGATRWDRPTPYLRQTLTEVATVLPGHTLRLTRPVGVEFPAGAEVIPIRSRRGVHIRGLTIEYAIPGAPDPLAYTNARPLHRVDGIRIVGAVEPEIREVEIRYAGRHPLNLDGVLAPKIADLTLNGAWNKGAEGNGYLRIARTYYGRFDRIRIRGLRHLAIQWSSHDNTITGLDSDTDVNFHGGYTQRNRVHAARLAPRAGHPWPRVFRTPSDAPWAPPDGAGNTVVDAGPTPAPSRPQSLGEAAGR